MGIFAGRLQYKVYKGTDLLRMEVIAKTDQHSVAYKYDAGLKGIEVRPETKAVWRDTANQWQSYEFTGAVSRAPAVVRSANRLLAMESAAGRLLCSRLRITFSGYGRFQRTWDTRGIGRTAIRWRRWGCIRQRMKKTQPMRGAGRKIDGRTSLCITPGLERGRGCRCTF
jgi:hypothetical protein